MNPFNYQGPVDPAHLIDRRSELDALQRAAADRIAVRLAAPRRFGKSSPLDAHIRIRSARSCTVIASEHRIARSTLQDELERLLADQRQVRRNEAGKPYLLDPVFAEWLRRR